MRTAINRASPRKLLRSLLLACALGSLVAGCKTTGEEAPPTTGAIGSSGVLSPSDLGPEQALAAVQKWGGIYGNAPKDRVAALNYAAALRAAGQTKQAVAVMRKATIYNPKDREVLAAFGKALAADGQFREALATVRRAQREDNPDWQLLAAEGGILDSLGDYNGARALYNQALVLAPGDPQVLNNLGLSYALTNELDAAEDALRQAAASPKATLKVRQNLELVLSLKGKSGTGAKLAEAPMPEESEGAAPPEATAPQENIWEELAENS